jgi:peptidoglycan/LPS O-acetylase OafA/YrhL
LASGKLINDIFPVFIDHLFFITNIREGRFSEKLFNTVLWSLEIEVQFYVLLPLLAYIYKLQNQAKRIFVLIFSVIAVFLIKYAFISNYPSFPATLLDYFPYFVGGIVLAEFNLQNKNKASVGFDILAILNLIIILMLFQTFIIGRSLILSLLLCTMILFFYKSKYFYKVLVSKIFIFIGGISYSIYLWHLLITKFLINSFEIKYVEINYLNFCVLILVYLLPTICICLLFYLMTERPFMKLNKKIIWTVH